LNLKKLGHIGRVAQEIPAGRRHVLGTLLRDGWTLEDFRAALSISKRYEDLTPAEQEVVLDDLESPEEGAAAAAAPASESTVLEVL